MTCVFRATRPAVRRSRGFTLIEVLMAAFVMAIGVLGLTALFAGAARQQQLSSQTTRSVSAARSADAFIAERFGPIADIQGNTVLQRGTSIPPNGQTPATDIVPDQWYVIPRSTDGSLSLNPKEAADGWRDTSLFVAARPREALPKLLFRARMERNDGELIPTGLTGANALGTGLGAPLTNNSPLGAPSFDGAMRELRVIAESVTLRIITRGFPCSSTSADERSIVTPDDREYVLTYQGNMDGTEFRLEGASGVIARLQSNDRKKDSELFTGGADAGGAITFVKVDEVIEAVDSVASCQNQGQNLWVVEPSFDPESDTPTTPCQIQMVGSPEYLYQVPAPAGNLVISPFTTSSGNPGYVLNRNPDGTIVAQLKLSDRADCGVSGTLYSDTVGGDYFRGPRQPEPLPPGWTGPLGAIRKIQIPTRFIHEIWLEDYAYRGHTVASLPESVSYGEAAGAAGARMPQIGYSMLFRRTSDSKVQYAIVSYAITPTYSPVADSPASTDDDFFPMESRDDVQVGRAPLRLAESLRIEFDEELGQYYIPVRDTALNWVATPGQVLLFNGDASSNVPGADAPVKVVSVRKRLGGEQRAYLDGPPRAGLRPLPDFDQGEEFDAWAVSPACDVQRIKQTKVEGYKWGLRAIDARIFTVSQQ